MGRKTSRRTKGLTMHNIVFVRVQRVQNVEETLNEFKPTRLVSRKVGGRTEWEGRTRLVTRRMAGRTGWEIRRVEGEWDCDCARHCVWEGPEGSYS